MSEDELCVRSLKSRGAVVEKHLEVIARGTAWEAGGAIGVVYFTV